MRLRTDLSKQRQEYGHFQKASCIKALPTEKQPISPETNRKLTKCHRASYAILNDYI